MKKLFINLAFAGLLVANLAKAETNPLDVFNASHIAGSENQEAEKNNSGYAAIDMEDLKVDLKDVAGKKLAVAAYIQSFADTAMLKNNPMDMTPIFASADKLPREDRKKLINQCDAGQCVGIFYGVIKKSPEGYKFFIDKVEWD